MKTAQKIFVLVFALLAACAARARAWYWPFGYDEDSTNAPPRLHRLLEKANDYIELAEEDAQNGEVDKAIGNYKLALAELDRVEAQYPERAATSEFAPLRNRRAVCSAAIDTIRFAQVNNNERPVSVSDTSELQKKWNKKHGVKEERDEGEGTRDEGQGTRDKWTEVKEEAKAETKGEEKKVEEPKVVVPEGWMEKFKAARELVRAGDYAAADVALEALLKEQPNNLNALLLRAAAQSGTGSNYAARRTLEKAMRAHPRSYLPYYNLAHLALALGEGAEAARQYYEMGRTVGGPAQADLEAKLK